jgi:hypothetical protein
MSYVYLMELHRRIDTKIAEAKQTLIAAGNDWPRRKFHEGRIDILMALKKYLTENLSVKLPRRLRKPKV